MIEAIQLEGGSMKLQIDVPDGYGHLVVEAGTDILQGLHHPLASGGVNGYGGKASFTLPEAGRTMFFKIRAGVETDPPTATYMGGRYFHFKGHEFGGGPLDADQSRQPCLESTCLWSHTFGNRVDP